MTEGTPMLAVEELEVAYGQIRAVKGVSFSVAAGEVVTLIGANGAGKTTTLRTLSGLLPPAAGSVAFEGRRIDGVPAHRIVGLGIAHVPEGRRIFPRMSVSENLELGAFTRYGRSPHRPATGAGAPGRTAMSRQAKSHQHGRSPHRPATGAGAPGRTGSEQLGADFERVYELFPVLAERRSQAGGTLSGGEQQMLAIGRALMSRPRLLMLDEPSMGLSPIMMNRIFDTLAELKAQGTTILLVEQNAAAALALADRGYVIETGQVVLSGTGAELLASEDVRKAYLGED